VRFLELVLDVEQPDPDRRRQQRDRQVHHQEWLDADQPHRPNDQEGNRCIGRHRADPRAPAPAHGADRQPVLQQEKIGGTDAEHYRRMTVEPIVQPSPSGKREVFAHRQRVDIADAAMVEVAGARMMDGVAALPVVVRRQRQRTDHATHPIVRQLVTEE
jgi:hypothetical protein